MKENKIYKITDDGSSKPYVPPSEQQVFEPKKYTGANIPSRSFRLLQAMTQPENAGEYCKIKIFV